VLAAPRTVLVAATRNGARREADGLGLLDQVHGKVALKLFSDLGEGGLSWKSIKNVHATPPRSASFWPRARPKNARCSSPP
jgi:hypothetical protein